MEIALTVPCLLNTFLELIIPPYSWSFFRFGANIAVFLCSPRLFVWPHLHYMPMWVHGSLHGPCGAGLHVPSSHLHNRRVNAQEATPILDLTVLSIFPQTHAGSKIVIPNKSFIQRHLVFDFALGSMFHFNK